MSSTHVDITRIPFSRYGAFLSVTREDNGAQELIIHTARRRFKESAAFSLSFGGDFTCAAQPEALLVTTSEGHARIYIRDDETLVIESFGPDIFLRQFARGYGTETGERAFRVYHDTFSLISTVAVPCGKALLDGPVIGRNRRTDLSVTCEEGHILMALRLCHAEPREIPLPLTPDADISAIRTEWESFLGLLPAAPAADAETEAFVRLTWYNLWSCFVRAGGCYPADTMLMSKKYMTSTWSWDHCFNALAMAHLADRELAKKYALSQFSAPFHLQGELGVLPDMWNPDLETRWGTTKPPIHGWCFGKLMDIFNFTRDELLCVYRWLSKWTCWWTEHSDTDNDGIPDYPQGCDSGWDNCSLFDNGYFMETPDLPALLILQMRTLARIAEGLGDETSAAHWRTEAKLMGDRLFAHSFDGERFLAKQSRTHLYDAHPTSLLSLMPLVLGEQLPGDVLQSLAESLQRDFLTENGLATEMPDGGKYESDGYWRGPIWAPTTYLLVDGLRRGGQDALARTVAERYCRMSARIARGNFENFDALTGLGRRAPGYTWAASVYMLLHFEYGC
ncbi:MAG: hypothetical protein IJC53_01220 [Clostridia bacterium]|nr:hypothetical protein [Clostridia bacterium]